MLVKRTNHKPVRAGGETEGNFTAAMARHPIAMHAAATTAQHYKLPPDFFRLILGPRLKYSCCLNDGAATRPRRKNAPLSKRQRTPIDGWPEHP